MTKHHVTVENGKLTKFVCEDNQAKCHTYPRCECEEWSDDHEKDYGKGHESVHHDACWMQWWFDNMWATLYQGEDHDDMQDNQVPTNLTRAGYITTAFDECVTWEFED